MNDLEAINAVKDIMQTYLEDPLTQWGGDSRNWIHTDEPLTSARYPRIQIVKRGPTNVEIHDMGFDFTEHRELILDIYFWTKLGFKWKDENDEYLTNDRLVMKYLDKIWKEGIKPYQIEMRDSNSLFGFKNLGEDMPLLEGDTQLYRGAVGIRLWYWTS